MASAMSPDATSPARIATIGVDFAIMVSGARSFQHGFHQRRYQAAAPGSVVAMANSRSLADGSKPARNQAIARSRRITRPT